MNHTSCRISEGQEATKPQFLWESGGFYRGLWLFYGILWDFMGFYGINPLGMTNIAIEDDPCIADLPTPKMVIFYRYVNVYQRVLKTVLLLKAIPLMSPNVAQFKTVMITLLCLQ